MGGRFLCQMTVYTKTLTRPFLGAIRDPEIWAKTKKGAAAAGGFTMELLRDLAKGFIKKQVEELTGVKIG